MDAKESILEDAKGLSIDYYSNLTALNYLIGSGSPANMLPYMGQQQISVSIVHSWCIVG